jgi:Zn-dependent protease with chaperone function
MTARGVRRRCRELTAGLEIPIPFSVQRLAERIARTRGRPIELVPAAMPNSAPCGIWFATDDRDIIVYETNTSALHQEHIVLHELGHLLCGHEPISTSNSAAAQLLFPDLDPDMVHRTLHRSHYALDLEQEAEMVASLILARTRRMRPAPEWVGPPDGAAARGRIARALEAPDDRE